MIIVWGAIEASEQNLAELLALSLAHVRRSRLEPGCIQHSVQIDAENPHRIVFYEEWQDTAALQTHFAVPASNDFVRQLRALCQTTPEMKIYRAEPVEM
ncbi:putative quinol monooxygenase [Arenicella xantha]|uniref:Quinol monooxygenase YgiN n=1 Tax=Arenicella xantha TaxID=644221 RepID=A0A395JLN8_9GAMM|nr:putative quinol monooxygenase [Arenicella xantha]RBP51703.1 quinol monooxygenase YgiN [Arenicella xantha]